MKALSPKVEKFLKQLKHLENATPGERQKAVHLLTDTLEGRNIYILKSYSRRKNIVRELRAARTRLEDIHNRLELTIKSGNSSSMIH